MAVPRQDLMCDVSELRYDFDTRTGKLLMAENGSCSMAGLIALFTKIDPGAKRIVTFSGRVADGLFWLDAREWQTVSLR